MCIHTHSCFPITLVVSVLNYMLKHLNTFKQQVATQISKLWLVLRLLIILLYNGGVINWLMPIVWSQVYWWVLTHTEIMNGQQLSIIQCTSGDIDPHYNSHLITLLSSYVIILHDVNNVKNVDTLRRVNCLSQEIQCVWLGSDTVGLHVTKTNMVSKSFSSNCLLSIIAQFSLGSLSQRVGESLALWLSMCHSFIHSFILSPTF